MRKLVSRMITIAFAMPLTVLIFTIISTAIIPFAIPSAPSRREERFGVYHWRPRFPSPTPAPNKLIWGTHLVSSMGTKTIRVELGYDEAGSYGFDPPLMPDNVNYLRLIAGQDPYSTLFADPRFSTYLITTYTYYGYNRCWAVKGNPSGSVCSPPANNDNPNDYYTASEANLEKEQIRSLGNYLLDSFPTKSFIILNWEGDGDLLGAECTLGGGSAIDRQYDYGKFIQARADGVKAAVMDHNFPGANTKLYSAVEISCVRAEGNFNCINGGSECARGALLYDNILKLLNVDYISYSSWQTSAASAYDRTPQDIKASIINDVTNIIGRATEGRPGAYTSANIILGEYGYDRGWPISATDYYQAVFDAAETLGVSHVIYWQAMDNPDITKYGLYTLNNGQTGRAYTGDVFTNLLWAKTFVASLVSWGEGRLDLFTREKFDQSIRHVAYDKGTWMAQENLGGVTTSEPAAVSWGSGRLDVFTKGEDDQIFQKTYSSNTWSNWASIGEPYSGSGIGAPVVSTWGTGRLDIFVRASNGATWHKAYSNGAWANWMNLEGIGTSEPVSVSWGAQRVDVFIRGTDDGIHQRSYTASGWQNWGSVGQPYPGSGIGIPTVSTWGPGRLDVFVRASDGVTWHRAYDNGVWANWESLGGVATSAPVAVSRITSQGVQKMDVFVRGTNGSIWQKSYTSSSGWNSAWINIGEPHKQSGIGSPIAYSWGSDGLGVFARASNDLISQTSYENGAWTNWNSRYCSVGLYPASQDFGPAGGPSLVPIRANTMCQWAATSNVPWVTITSSATGSGIGAIYYTVEANPSSTLRKGTLTIAGEVFSVTQAGRGLQFYPLAYPIRLLDTRANATGCFTPNAPISGGTSRTQVARGACNGLTIPPNAAAITGNITTVQSGGGYLTLYPSDATQPIVANSNYGPNEILNNVFTVGLGNADGAFKIFVTSNTDVVVDVTGYYAPLGTPGGLYFHPLFSPMRLLETRSGLQGCSQPGAPLLGMTETLQQARGLCGIPNTALAIVGNATTVNPQGSGSQYFTLFPADAGRPLAASSNYSAGQVMNAPFTVGLSSSGAFKIYPTTQTDLVVDVLGYYSADAFDNNGAGLLFNPLSTPIRLLDTRAGFSACDQPDTPLAAGATFRQKARDRICKGLLIPVTALAIIGNATVVNASGGYLTFWPGDAVQPTAATMNFSAGQVINRHFTVGLGADSNFNIFAQFKTDLILDVSGYFAPSP